MADIRIDRLTLSLPGFAAPDAQRLVRLIAAQIGRRSTASHGLSAIGFSGSERKRPGADRCRPIGRAGGRGDFAPSGANIGVSLEGEDRWPGNISRVRWCSLWIRS